MAVLKSACAASTCFCNDATTACCAFRLLSACTFSCSEAMPWFASSMVPAIAFSALQGGLGLHQLGAGRFQSRLCVDDIARSRALSGLLGGLSCRHLRAQAVNHGGRSAGLRLELRGIEHGDQVSSLY